MKELVSQQAFAKATHLEKFGFATKALMNLSKINALNDLYSNTCHTKGIAFIESVFKQLELSYHINEKELNRIPKSGPFICIANHPLGALDGLLVLYLISKVRDDFKVMANFLLKEIEPLSESFIAVNPFREKISEYSSIEGMKSALKWLNQGSGLGIFPAGEVSSFQPSQARITDKKWKDPVLKLIRNAEVPIIPMHFRGKNSLTFQLLGLIHPNLRTVALPSEMLKKRKTEIKIRIGKAISAKDQKKWKNYDHLGRYLRARVYAMDNSSESREIRKQKNAFKQLEKVEKVEDKVATKLLQDEIDSIEDLKIIDQANFSVYLVPARRIPFLLIELGRLRELTFREIGEGSFKSTDLDKYDRYYEHLILWDREKKAVAGSYRLGDGRKIMKKKGKKGFYIHSLFKIANNFSPILDKSIELGRSFIIKEYQQQRLPLFLLWKGIVHKLRSDNEYQYLIGPVSISNQYCKLSQLIIVEFIKKHHYNNALAKYIRSRKKFKVRFRKTEDKELINITHNDLRHIDDLLCDIEPSHIPVPILIKKYIKQNAKIIGFNIDPKFNYTLDGLMMLNIMDLPKNSLNSLI